MNFSELSVKIILENQSKEGAYIASPNFSQYGYCWFRDGSFIAAAMARTGELESAKRFFDWGFRVIDSQKGKIEKILSQQSCALNHEDLLPTRYNLDGSLTQDNWPNGQSDGYGTFLWAIGKYAPKELIRRNIKIVELVSLYLEKIWTVPCFDVWEEHPDGIHTSTLFSIAAGLRAAEGILKQKTKWEEIMSFIKENLVLDKRLKKSTVSDDIDASLVWGAVPFELLPVENSLMVNTVKEIVRKLYVNGGVKRYSSDTYFGGGSWILLSAVLGQYYFRRGEFKKAEQIRKWIEKHFDAQGLPEQVPEYLIDDSKYCEWVQRWGEIAKPLLWSHACYLDLLSDMEGRA